MTPVVWAILVWCALAVITVIRAAARAFDSPIELGDKTAPDPRAPGNGAER